MKENHEKKRGKIQAASSYFNKPAKIDNPAASNSL